MAKKVTLGSTKRFGPRYGAKNREKVAVIEKQHHGRHKCPFCNYVKVKRVSAGIWSCEKCNETFTGKAYTFENKKKKSISLLKKEKKSNDDFVLDEDFEKSDPIEKEEGDEETTETEEIVEEAKIETPEEEPKKEEA